MNSSLFHFHLFGVQSTFGLDFLRIQGNCYKCRNAAPTGIFIGGSKSAFFLQKGLDLLGRAGGGGRERRRGKQKRILILFIFCFQKGL